MSGKRNLTVQLDAETIRKAKVVAAERGTSVSKLVAEQIEKLASERDTYLAAKERALARLATGYHMGGPPYPKRDELYDR